MKKSIINLLLLLAICCFTTFAQTDSRNRKPETVVADNLTQLPAQSGESYDKIMGELAGTGAVGIELLTNMLSPDDAVDNSKAEYAIDGVVNYVSASGREELRELIHDALVNALSHANGQVNKAFILSQLNKIATAADFNLYKELLSDKYLAHLATAGLCHISGIDSQLTALINSASVPSADLAYIAYFRKLGGVERALTAWAASDDKATKSAALDALSVCGSHASIKTLKKENTDAYLQLLDNLTPDKAVVKEAKELIKNKNSKALRCAGLRLLLKSEPDKAPENIIKALKDRDAGYRHTALVNAIPAAGEGIISLIADSYSKLPEDAKIDVIHWLGDIHATQHIPLVTAAFGSSDTKLAVAAVKAAAKIGGESALEAILPLLGRDDTLAGTAAESLLTFNGDINRGIVESLQSDKPNTLKAALQIASSRHIHGAYDAVVALTKSTLPDISTAAFKALDGVADASKVSTLATMLQTSTGNITPLIQKSMLSALAPESPAAQFDAIQPLMASAKNPALYYPMLAQSGTPEAVAILTEGYNSPNREAALQALLMVDNPDERDTIFGIASQASGADRDALLQRYVALLNKSNLSPVQAYTAYSRALDLNPDNAVKQQIIASLTQCGTFPAAMLAATYLNDEANAFTAANALAEIIKSDEQLQQGSALRDAAEKALKVFAAEKSKGNADAGYAADMVRGLLENWKNDSGFRSACADGPIRNLSIDKNLENIELCFDWLGKGDAIVTLRSMPLVLLSASNGITLAGGDAVVASSEGWNNINVKYRDDRIFLDVNGETIALNQVIAHIPGSSKAAPALGEVAIASADGSDAILRNVYINQLPATPVYTLSTEEAEQGFELLFDGRSLENFHGNMSNYVPQDGNIYVTAQYGGSGNLYTKKNYSDFIFRFEFFFDQPAVNNGIGIRTGRDVTGVDAAYEGMEIQILDHDDPVYQGYNYNFTGLHPYQQHGGVYGIAVPKHIDFGPIRQWHTEEIKAIGDRITVTVDGEIVTDVNIREITQGHNVSPDGSDTNPYTLDHNNHPGLFNKEGYISFCGHGPGLKFRNVRVLDLSKKRKK